MISKKDTFYLDFQTTGFHSQSEVIEVGFGRSSGDSLEVTTFLVAPQAGIPRPILLMTGLSLSEFDSAMSFEDFKVKLSEFLVEVGEAPLVIHFAQFENQFLKRLQLASPQVYCTYEIARRLHPKLASKSLKALAGYLGHSHSEYKRSKEHIEATHFIWEKLLAELESRDLNSKELIQEFLSQPAPKKEKKKIEKAVRIEDAIRLSLPAAPGVYQMKNKAGQILYIGKAKNLKSRVNSYYRGQKTKKLKELTSQVWEIDTIQTGSHFEACLLENDLIKKIHPPYNTALKTSHRALIYFDAYLEPTFEEEGAKYGPFTQSSAYEMLDEVQSYLLSASWSHDTFYESIDPELMVLGFEHFCVKHDFYWTSQVFRSEGYSQRRGILASILRWSVQKGLKRNLLSFLTFEVHRVPYDETSETYTVDEVAEKFYRSFLRLALIHQRPHWIKRLAYSDILVKESGDWKPIYMRDAEMMRPSEFSPQSLLNATSCAEAKQIELSTSLTVRFAHCGHVEWDNLRYDRISILLAELSRELTRERNQKSKNESEEEL